MIGMKKALQICGIKSEGTHHRALDDTKNITKIFTPLEKATRPVKYSNCIISRGLPCAM